MLFAIGVALALPVFWMLSKYVQLELCGIHAVDWQSILAATAIVTLVAAVSGYVPARRATQVDPMLALRYE